MMYRFILLLIIAGTVEAQQLNFLPRNINHSAKNNIYPFVSADGKTMLFLSDYSEDDELWLNISQYKAGKWQDPEEIEGIGATRLNNIGGYSLSNDGQTLWFSSKKADGLGGYDVWSMQKGKTRWSVPANAGKPLNSDRHEGNPAISPDGQRLYFMRCKQITRGSSEGCSLYYSDRNPGVGRPWKEPVELPDFINVGNTVSPRMLSDNKTLVFSSDRPGGLGHLDLWMTKRDGDHWSEPENLAFANTEDNDQFISISLRSDQAFFTRKDKNGFGAIVQARVPERYRPDNVIMVIGKVLDDDGNPYQADIRINNFSTGMLVSRGSSNKKDGSFTFVMPEKATYEVTYSERSGNKAFITDLYDAQTLAGSRREYPTIVLKDIVSSAMLPMNSLVFQPFSSNYLEHSRFELLRLSRLMKKHPEINVEVGVYQSSYLEDDEPSNEDLTEQLPDTIMLYEPAIETSHLSNLGIDSLLSTINDTLSHTFQDTLLANVYLERMSGTVDSVLLQNIRIRYHNNRTQLQADNIKSWLVEKGIAEDRVNTVGYNDRKPPFDFAKKQDRLVVITIL